MENTKTSNQDLDYLLSIIKSGLSLAEMASEQDLIVVCGESGSGKSTTINYLLDCSMERQINKIIVNAESAIPEFLKIGHKTDESQSETNFPVIVGNSKFKIMECPGSEAKIEPIRKIFNTLSIKHAIDSARSLKFLFLIDSKTWFGDNNKGLQEVIRLATTFFNSKEMFMNNKYSVLIGISKLSSLTHEYESFNDIKESLQKNSLPKDLESCFITFDPLDEPLLGGLKKEEFVMKIEELLPVTRGEIDIDFSNEEKVKLNKIGAKLEALFEKGLNDFNNKENIVEIKQYLLILKLFNKFNYDGWHTNFRKIQSIFKEKNNKMIDKAKIKFQEFDAEMGDLYMDVLKVSEDIFEITDNCQIDELEKIRLESIEIEEAKIQDLTLLRKKFEIYYQEENFRDAEKTFDKLQKFHHNLPKELKKKIELDLDVLMANLKSLKPKNNQNKVENADFDPKGVAHFDPKGVADFDPKKVADFDPKGVADLDVLMENLKPSKPQNNQNKVANADFDPKGIVKVQKLKWGVSIFILIIAIILIWMENEYSISSYLKKIWKNELQEIKLEIENYHIKMRQKPLDDAELKVVLDFSRNFSHQISFFNVSYAETRDFFQKMIDKKFEDISQNKINPNDLEILIRASYLLKGHLKFNDTLLNTALKILNPEGSIFFIGNIPKYIEEDRDYKLLNELFSKKKKKKI